MMQALDTNDLSVGPEIGAGVTAEVREVQDVSTDLEQKSPRINLVMDRDKAAALGLNVSQSRTRFMTARPKWSSTIYGPASQYRVLIEVDPSYRSKRIRQEDRVQGALGRVGAARHGRELSGGVGPQSITIPVSCRRCRCRLVSGPACRWARPPRT